MKRYYSVSIVCVVIFSLLLSGCGARIHTTAKNALYGEGLDVSNLDTSDVTDETDGDGSVVTDPTDVKTLNTIVDGTNIYIIPTDENGNDVTDPEGNLVTQIYIPSTTQTDTDGNIITEPNNNTTTLSGQPNQTTTLSTVEVIPTTHQVASTTSPVTEIDGHELQSVHYLANISSQGVTMRYDTYYMSYGKRIVYQTHEDVFDMSSLSNIDDNSVEQALKKINIPDYCIPYLIAVFHRGPIVSMNEYGTFDDITLDVLSYNNFIINYHLYNVDNSGKKKYMGGTHIDIPCVSSYSYVFSTVQTKEYNDLVHAVWDHMDLRYIQELKGY